MKNLTGLVLIAALLLSGCSLFERLTKGNEAQLTYGEGIVVSPLTKVNGEWVITVEETLTGTTVTLVCPPDLLKKCGNLEYFDAAKYTVQSVTPTTKALIKRLSIDKK